MKKLAALIVGLSLICFSGSPAIARKFYKTYEVVAVTEKTLVLQRKKGEKIEIDRARRPYLGIGDRVRYDKHRDRLGRTLDGE